MTALPLQVQGNLDEGMLERVGGFQGYRTDAEVIGQAGMIDAVAAGFEGRGEADRVDGLTVSGPDWWLNVRSSNTEPLLRLNVEARTEEQMASLRDDALAIIRGEAAQH